MCDLAQFRDYMANKVNTFTFLILLEGRKGRRKKKKETAFETTNEAVLHTIA